MERLFYSLIILSIIGGRFDAFGADGVEKQFAGELDFAVPKIEFESVAEPFGEFGMRMPYVKSIAKVTGDVFYDFSAKNSLQNWIYEKGPLRYYYFYLSDSWIPYIVNTPTGETLSAEQKALIQQKTAVFMKTKNPMINHPPEYLVDVSSDVDEGEYPKQELYFVGVSEEEVRKTVIAFLELKQKQREYEFQGYLRSLEGLEVQYNSQTEELESLNDKYEEVQKRLKDLRKQTLYSDNDEAKGAIKRMNEQLEVEEVELAAVQSKLETVNEKLNDEIGVKQREGQAYKRQSIFNKLEELSIELAVELADLKSRVAAIMKVRELAAEYLDANSEYRQIGSEIDVLEKLLGTISKELAEVKEKLSQCYDRPFRVDGNKVIVGPYAATLDKIK